VADALGTWELPGICAPSSIEGRLDIEPACLLISDELLLLKRGLRVAAVFEGGLAGAGASTEEEGLGVFTRVVWGCVGSVLGARERVVLVGRLAMVEDREGRGGWVEMTREPDASRRDHVSVLRLFLLLSCFRLRISLI
jgi:uncharacterized membrane protein YeaQ/YmgE (transglycosylase-associated protein family)